MMDLRKAVLESIAEIAPEVPSDSIEGGRPLREQIDLDSMDWLNVIVKVNERTGVDIPERDYKQLVSLDTFVAYLSERRR